jgi:hypothetical protein
VIPDFVNSIGFAAFFGCSGLTSVIVPDSVTSLGVDAFIVCDRLEQVIAPARFHFLIPGIASVTEPTQYLLK